RAPDRARDKAARAAVATIPPNRAETLPRDGRTAARFYARFGITERAFRRRVPAASLKGVDPAPGAFPGGG
ncbi:MAG: hypothetical protein ACLPWO_08385, partial [Thermoplasmata archaeon]